MKEDEEGEEEEEEGKIHHVHTASWTTAAKARV